MNRNGVVFVLILAGLAVLMLSRFGSDDVEKLVDNKAPAPSDFGETPEKVALDPDKQKTIWDAEHITFEIERRLGPLLLDEIQQNDVDALVKRCHSQFQGTLPAETRLIEREKFPLSVRSLPPEFEARAADAARTMAHIVALNQRLQSVQSRRLRVLAIENDAAEKSVWKCRFLLTFSGPDAQGGQRLVESESRVGLRFDDEKDLISKPVLASWIIDHQTERSCSEPLMQEISDVAGLKNLDLPDNWELPHQGALQYRFQMSVEDFDRDGDADITLTTVAGRRFVLVNTPGEGFTDQTAELGLPEYDRKKGSARFVSLWFDYDNDGYADLLSGTQLFHNDGGTHFTDVTNQSRLTFDRETMGASVADYNGDGLLDLYVLYQKPFAKPGEEPLQQQAQWVDETGTGKTNQLWKNLGRGRFIDVTSGAQAGGYKRHTHAAAWFHYDDDQWPDLYIANDFGRNVVLRNTGKGKFEDVTDSSGAGGFATSMGVCTGDVDNDGATDVYVANMYSKMGRRIIAMVSDSDYPQGIYPQIQGSCAGNRLYCRDSADSSMFREISEQAGVNAVGWAWGPAMFDADNDGLLDLYSTSGFMSFRRDKPDG